MNIYVMTQLFLTILAAVTLCVAILGCRAPKAKYAIFVVLLFFIYSFGYLLLITSTSQEGAFMGYRVGCLSACFSSPCFLLFTCDYCDRPLRNKGLLTLLLAPGLVFYAGMSSWPSSTLYYNSIEYITSSAVPYLLTTKGPLYLPAVVYFFLPMLLSAIIIIQHTLATKHKTQKKDFLLLLGILPPFIATALRHADILFNGYDPIPASMVISSVTIGLYGIKEYVPQWMSYAREAILEEMDDAYILVDPNNLFLDANQRALTYFPVLSSLNPQSPLPESLAQTGIFADSDDEQETRDYRLEIDGQTHYMHISKTLIHQNEKLIGTSFMFFDITQKQRVLQQLSTQAQRDALTGLLNHGAWIEQANIRLAQDLSTQNPGSLLMMDIDHFKRVNDSYGHLVGDAVLSGFAQDLREFFRDDDICGRYGGEEFCVYLPNSNLEHAAQRAEALRRQIAAGQYDCDGVIISITLSIGLTSLEDSSSNLLADLISEADTALYQAKATGRNRVCRYTEPAVERAASG